MNLAKGGLSIERRVQDHVQFIGRSVVVSVAAHAFGGGARMIKVNLVRTSRARYGVCNATDILCYIGVLSRHILALHDGFVWRFEVCRDAPQVFVTLQYCLL